MSSRDVRALVEFRLEQADETLRAARLLQSAEIYRQAVGRAYYAMYYAVLALLASRGLGTSKHSGAIGLFNREFVKTGQFEPKLSKSLHELFDLRQRADYREMFEISPHRVESAIAAAEQFISQVSKYLDDEMDGPAAAS